ncbi:MAG: IS481 family transposase [bacterium]
MTVYGSRLPGAGRIANWAERVGNLTPAAKRRLKIMDWHVKHGENISLTARHFGLERKTVRRWRDRLQQCGVLGLNDRSRRPHNTRRPTTSPTIISRTVQLRQAYGWSKHKLTTLLEKEGHKISASTVGRILKRRDLINSRVSHQRRRAALHPKRRHPKGLKIARPGDLVQLDTKELTLVGGRKLYQFTAIDVLTKLRVLFAHPSLASTNGAAFLVQCLLIFPFKLRAVQTDNGSEFLGAFQKLCERKELPQFFIHPRCAQENTYVERSHGTDEREFYQRGNLRQTLPAMRRRLQWWEKTYNEVRPHESLNMLTPQEYLKCWQTGRLPTKDVITLQT